MELILLFIRCVIAQKVQQHFDHNRPTQVFNRQTGPNHILHINVIFNDNSPLVETGEMRSLLHVELSSNHATRKPVSINTGFSLFIALVY